MGNGTQMTSAEEKISSQIAFNSFLTGANIYTNMKINKSMQEVNKSMQEANALNQKIQEEGSKQTSLMEQDLAIKQKEQQEKEFIKQVKDSVFQINNELKKLANEKDLLNTFISLESLYATMVTNNVTTDVVPDLQDKEYIQNVYDGIEKLKKETESNFSKRDIEDKKVLLDILEEDEEAIIKEYESQDVYKKCKEIDNIFIVSDDEFAKCALKYLRRDHNYLQSRGFTTVEVNPTKSNFLEEYKKEGNGSWLLLMFVSGSLGFGFGIIPMFVGDAGIANIGILIASVYTIHLSINKIYGDNKDSKRVTHWSSGAPIGHKYTEEDRKEFVSIIKEKFSDEFKNYYEIVNKIEELKKTITDEIGPAKELVARRPFLIDLLKARAVVV